MERAREKTWAIILRVKMTLHFSLSISDWWPLSFFPLDTIADVSGSKRKIKSSAAKNDRLKSWTWAKVFLSRRQLLNCRDESLGVKEDNVGALLVAVIGSWCIAGWKQWCWGLLFCSHAPWWMYVGNQKVEQWWSCSTFWTRRQRHGCILRTG